MKSELKSPYKLKKGCLECYYWTGKGGIGKACKCYTKNCPARQRDEATGKRRL